MTWWQPWPMISYIFCLYQTYSVCLLFLWNCLSKLCIGCELCSISTFVQRDFVQRNLPTVTHNISCRFELFPFCFVQIQSGQLEALYSLLASYYFLYANVRHGLLHHLLEIYSSCGECEWQCWMTNVVTTCDSWAALLTVLPFNPSHCVVSICWWMMVKPKILMFVSCDILPFL